MMGWYSGPQQSHLKKFYAYIPLSLTVLLGWREIPSAILFFWGRQLTEPHVRVIVRVTSLYSERKQRLIAPEYTHR